jgi:hypothetical protein
MYQYNHPVFKQSVCAMLSRGQVEVLFLSWAIEGFDHLARWSLQPERNSWDARKEYLATRTASFFGRAGVVDLFISTEESFKFSSSLLVRLRAAALGAAEGGRKLDLERYWAQMERAGFDPEEIIRGAKVAEPGAEEKVGPSTSIIGIALRAYLVGGGGDASRSQSLVAAQDDNRGPLSWVASSLVDAFCSQPLVAAQDDDLATLSWVLSRARLPPESLLTMMVCSRELLIYRAAAYDRLILVFQWLVSLKCTGTFDPAVRLLCKQFVKRLISIKMSEKVQMKDIALRLIKLVAARETSIPGLLEEDDIDLKRPNVFSSFVAALEELQTGQRREWGKSDPEEGVASNGLETSSRDSQRRAERTLAGFLSSHFRRRQALKEKERRMGLHTFRRGSTAQRTNQGTWGVQSETVQRFQGIWSPCLSILNEESYRGYFSWEATKGFVSDSVVHRDEVWMETSHLLDSALLGALEESDESIDSDNEEECQADQTGASALEANKAGNHTHQVKLTKYAVKWVKDTDTTYRGFFVAKIKRLAAGDRSRTLSKRL